jgi:hypothetical protein
MNRPAFHAYYLAGCCLDTTHSLWPRQGRPGLRENGYSSWHLYLQVTCPEIPMAEGSSADNPYSEPRLQHHDFFERAQAKIESSLHSDRSPTGNHGL